MLPWIVVLCVAATLASAAQALGVGGVFFSAFLLLLAASIYRGWWLVGAIVLVLNVLVLLLVLSPSVGAAHEAVRQMICIANLKQLGCSLCRYHEKYGRFPPTYVADASGNPMRSWRVLLLPFIECGTLHEKYKFDEPWDSPSNEKLLKLGPPQYRCPSHGRAYDSPDSAYTSYVALVGPEAAWAGEGPQGWDDPDFRGKKSSTILLIEVEDTDIPWTEPKDYVVERSSVDVGLSGQVMIGSPHVESNGPFVYPTPVVHVVLADGAIHSLPIEGLAESGMFKRGGADQAAIDRLWSSRTLRTHWPKCIASVLWVISVSLLLFLAVQYRTGRLKLAPTVPS